jgi:hypothetical protein
MVAGGIVSGFHHDPAPVVATGVNYPAGGGLQRRQHYYPWNSNGGRLQDIQVGTSQDPTAKLSLANMTYDPGATWRAWTTAAGTPVSRMTAATG